MTVPPDGSNLLLSLVAALLRLPCLTELADRNLVVRLLGYELGPLEIEENPRAFRHLLSIVEACHRHPDGLTKLLNIIVHLDQESKNLPGVRRIIDEMTALEVWPTGERDQVFRLLSGMVFADIVELYRQVAGDNAPRLPAQTTYREVFLTLETLNAGPNGLPRPIVFVEHLADRVRPELAIELRRWADRQAARLKLLTELQALRRTFKRPPPGPPPNSPAYLVLQLQHEGPTGNRLRLCHWQQLDMSDGWHPERGEDFVGSLDEVKMRIATLIEGVEANWARHQPEIRVEVVLAGELLNLDIDQWPWEAASPIPAPVGCHFPVVIRSLERMRSGQWHRAWHTRWTTLITQLRSHGAIAAQSGLHGKAGDEQALRALTADFEKNPELVSLTLSAPPRPDMVGRDEIAVGLRAGVPIMVWHREDCGSEDFVSIVQELLHGDGPDTLLERARRVRATAHAADSGHVGHHLALLWDDPNRTVIPCDPTPPRGASAA